jgi:annexin A7/11
MQVRILCSRSFPQLKATFEAYAQISGNDIEKAIKKEFSGDLEKCCLAICKSAKSKFRTLKLLKRFFI